MARRSFSSVSTTSPTSSMQSVADKPDKSAIVDDPHQLIRLHSDGTFRLTLTAKPKSSRDDLVYTKERGLVVRLTAAPVDGKANAALQDFLADLLQIPKRSVVLVRGDTARHKEFSIGGLDQATLLKRLYAAIHTDDDV